MRDEKEVGGFPELSEKVNLAYRTYASLYLDFVDDNMKHFTWRNIDISPIEDLDENDPDYDDEAFNAYVEEAISIAEASLSSGYWKSYEELYQTYPLLKDYSDRMEAVTW